jgi:signal transduction histidine kinase
MKLSIQFLQKSIRDNREDVLVLTQKVTETLIEQIENLAQIASQFSQFALISQVSASKNDLLKIIDNSVLLYNQNENNVIVNFQKPALEIMVWVDKNQFVSVFNNLILNAIQAIPENKEGLIDIKVTQENKQVFIELTDNGIGMEEEVIKKIFEPNFTTKSSGTGLGLAIANTIIKNADGSIRVESIVGQKTTFYITLPVYE